MKILEEDRKQDGKVYSKNPVLNEVLQNTQPFNQMDKTMIFGTQDVPDGGGMILTYNKPWERRKWDMVVWLEVHQNHKG